MFTVQKFIDQIKLLKAQCLIFATIVLCSSLSAQTYPVQLSTNLVPPYSGYLPDYADPSSEKLKVILQFNDFTVPHYNVRLKFEIKGNGFTLTTKQFYNPPPIQVEPGVPYMLSGADIAPYINSPNLDFVGINQSQYEQRMALPEGYYTICVKAFDYYNGGNIQVSNESCAQAWFTLSDPPFLNLPLCNAAVTPQTPQNILFQWTPMNLGSPNSALNTEYLFELWECRPDTNANPNQIAQSTPPIFSTTTQQTLLNYGLTEPPLNLYMKYVWRVKAQDVSGRDLFKNNGYSQICTFNYGSVANVLGNALTLNLSAQAVTHRMGKCTWNTQNLFTSYKLQVRKQGTANWFDYNTTQGSEKVTNLEPNTDYEAQVQGIGNGVTSAWSNIATFRTNNEPNYNCNDQTQLADPLQAQPLPPHKAIMGLVIQSGQFEVLTTQIAPTGAPGWYSGKGYARVFGLLPLAVKWDNIYIDDNNRHQQGIIQAMTKGVDNWLHQWDVNQATENAGYVQGTITGFSVTANGQYCYTLQGGSAEPICAATPTGVNVFVVRDDSGNEYTVQLIPAPPTVTGPTNYLQTSTDDLAACDSLQINFEASPNQNFGFDKKEYAANIPSYECIKLSNGQNYFVPFKSIGEGQTDEVMANVQIQNFNANHLSFKTQDGTALTSTSITATQYKITGIPATASYIYAWYNNKKIAKLNIVSLKPIAKKLVIVPVNGSNLSLPTGGGLEGAYKQANVTWSVTTASSFTFNLGNDGLEAADATLLSKYSTEMRALRDAYKQATPNYDKDAYYIFVVPNFNNSQLKGYMVRGRALGFVTSNANAKELAHELAHGAFGLEHTFPKIAESTTNNLLDYANGTQLTKTQWDEMQNPPAKVNWNDSEEDGQYCEFKAADRIVVFETLKQIKLCNTKNINYPITQIPNSRFSGYRIENVNIAGIQYDYIFLYKDLGSNIQKTSITPRNNISSEIKMGHYIETGEDIPYGLIKIDNAVYIEVPANHRLDMQDYLTQPESKNLMLFVNGYRNNISIDLEEFPNSINKVSNGDTYSYWSGLDVKFMNRLKVYQAVYADGHHKINTSNHGTQAKFMISLKSSMDLTMPTVLNTIPNIAGFNFRKANGMLAASDLLNKINGNTITFNKQTDTLFVVCHSMGFAYAQGMIEVLRNAGIKITRYYIIAPENGCSGSVDVNSFEEIWQYGTNEQNDPPKKRDGVAPQCPVGNIQSKRAYIPDGETKDFLNSHYIKNYHWIFTKLQLGDDGYVKQKK